MRTVKLTASSIPTSATSRFFGRTGSTPTEQTNLCGIFSRRERWSFSRRGWLLLSSTLLLVSYVVILNIYPFLAVTHQVNANVLVVEGWIHGNAIRAAAKEFDTGKYRYVFTTGGPIEGSGGYINDYQTWASVGADLLKKAGVPNESLQMVPSRVTARDRTYSSAVALRDWFREHEMAVKSFNIVTEDVHARRTRLLFREAFGNGVTIGIIAVPNPDYDAKHWWGYSEGVKDVISEGAAYIYARLFFWPGTSPRGDRTSEIKSQRSTVRDQTADSR